MDHYPSNVSHESDASSNTLTEAPTNRSVHPTRPPHWRLVASHSLLIKEVVDYPYNGSGTVDDPFVVEYVPYDPRDPMGFTMAKKWFLTVIVAVATLTVSFVSSAYSGGIKQVIEEFKVSEEIAILGIALYVLGFAVGPLFWAPLSELYGRQLIFFISFALFTAFNAGAAGVTNIAALIVLRCFAGLTGASALTNSGGVIGDMFPAAQRGLALSIFAAAPFMGPVLGPIVGNYVSETIGWRWVQGVEAIFSGLLWIIASLLVPETYGPVILRNRARALSKRTGRVYKSRIEISQGKISALRTYQVALSRPWALLFLEPIVFLLSLYLSIIYGVLYMLFAAFPIVFQEERGWSQGSGGLSFLGIAIGMILAVLYNIWDNKRFRKVEEAAVANGERGAPPEARLPPSIVGSFFLPLGLFGFAWVLERYRVMAKKIADYVIQTNYPSIHWIVSILFTVPFGTGVVLVFLGIFNYLIDAYTIYAASVLAANSVLRSSFGAAFPLFTTAMYHTLGIHWASTIPAFLSLICTIFPILFYHYGAKIRRSCKYSKEADDFMDKLKGQRVPPPAAVEPEGESPLNIDVSNEHEERDPEKSGENDTDHSQLGGSNDARKLGTDLEKG